MNQLQVLCRRVPSVKQERARLHVLEIKGIDEHLLEMISLSRLKFIVVAEDHAIQDIPRLTAKGGHGRGNVMRVFCTQVFLNTFLPCIERITLCAMRPLLFAQRCVDECR